VAYSGNTNYLGLRYIKPGDSNWFGDAKYNLKRIDALGMNFYPQNSPGGVSAYRVVLANGEIAEAIRVVPKANGSLDIHMGRTGYPDRIVFSGLAATSASVGIANSAPGVYAQYTLNLKSNYLAEFDSTFYFDTQVNVETTLIAPTDFAAAKPWVGSSMQLELEGNDALQRQSFLQFKVKDSLGVTRSFVVPAFII
jgi:hypothetical protein